MRVIESRPTTYMNHVETQIAILEHYSVTIAFSHGDTLPRKCLDTHVSLSMVWSSKFYCHVVDITSKNCLVGYEAKLHLSHEQN